MESAGKLTVSMVLPVECKSAGMFTPRNYAKYPSRKLEYFQLIFVRSGRFYIAEEGRSFEVGPNEAILLWPGRVHHGTRPNPLQLVYYWVYFTVRGEDTSNQDLSIEIPQHSIVERPDHMVALLHRVIDDREQPTYGGRTSDLALLLALSELGFTPGSRAGTETTATFANRADAVIRSTFHCQITTSSIASQIGCSADYLGRAYQKTYGVGVTEAIHRRRIQYAQHLLIMGELSLEDIARDSGFHESGYFRRIFKRHTGMTPRHYQSLNVRSNWDRDDME